MNRVLRYVLLVAGGLVLLPLIAGCAGVHRAASGVTITGKVHKGGKPIALGREGVLEVTFNPHPDAAEGKPHISYPADGVEAKDGSFTVRDIPPGKYRITIVLFESSAVPDRFKGAYGVKNSPFIRDVSEGVTIDLDLATAK